MIPGSTPRYGALEESYSKTYLEELDALCTRVHNCVTHSTVSQCLYHHLHMSQEGEGVDVHCKDERGEVCGMPVMWVQLCMASITPDDAVECELPSHVQI
jgi:hypothetical protein